MRKIFIIIAGIVVSICSANVFAIDTQASVCINKSTGRIRTYQSGCNLNADELSLDLLKVLVSEQAVSGAAGDTGRVGKRGERGDKGITGDSGQGVYDPLKRLSMIKGLIGGVRTAGSMPNNTAYWGLLESFNANLQGMQTFPQIIIAENSVVRSCRKNNADCLKDIDYNAAALCIGSAKRPSAPPGKVCVYLTSIENSSDVAVTNVGKTGLRLSWRSQTVDNSISQVEGVWAFTMP